MSSKQLSDGNPDGTLLGQGVSDKIGFYGVTAITCRSLPASLTVAATTAAQNAAINKLRNLLKLLRLGVE